MKIIQIRDNVKPWILFKLTDFGQWADRRRHQCQVNMLVGLILGFRLNMSDWVAHCEDRGIFASSWERRFSRWLENTRIDVIALYGPIVREILRGADRRELLIALDTSLLHNRICHVRFSVAWQGRAIPLTWKSFEHAGSIGLAPCRGKVHLRRRGSVMI